MYLWKVKAITQHGIIAKGMEVDVIVKNRSSNSKPNLKEIGESFLKKYDIKLPGGIPESTFEFIKG